MTGPQAIQAALKSSQSLLPMYLGDLSDADLLVRPVPEANHIAWQLGHLIVSESHLAKEALPNAKYPALPKGFAEQHTKETSAIDPPKGFFTKRSISNCSTPRARRLSRLSGNCHRPISTSRPPERWPISRRRWAICCC